MARETNILPGVTLSNLTKDAANIVPANAFSGAGWDKLQPQELTVVQNEGQALAAVMLVHGYSGLAIGEHLVAVQGILEPHNLFGRFLRQFHFSKRTAYRYISRFKNAKNALPDSVVKAAIARGMDIAGDSDLRPLGKYTEAAAKLPPPKEADIEQANTWLDSVEQVRKTTRAESPPGLPSVTVIPEDPQTALKEVVRFASSRYKKLPGNKRVRENWARQVLSMLMAEFGMQSAQQFAPMAVPSEWLARGRPRATASA